LFAAQVTAWFIIAVAAVGGALAMTGGLMGPAAGDSTGGSTGGGSGSTGSTGLGIGCLGIVLAAQVGICVKGSRSHDKECSEDMLCLPLPLFVCHTAPAAAVYQCSTDAVSHASCCKDCGLTCQLAVSWPC
jgi:hypothetical protein